MAARARRLAVWCAMAVAGAAAQSGPPTATPGTETEPSGARNLALEESFDVYHEHPRLFLRPARLKLLNRERERESIRWQQFQTLMAGKARMPEPGFAGALYARIAENAEAAGAAIEWAAGARETQTEDLRQIALVYDWLRDGLSDARAKALEGKLRRGVAALAKNDAISAVRSRVLAAVALGDAAPELARATLEDAVARWWRKDLAPKLRAGQARVSRTEIYALMETLHAIRDNLNIELRDDAPKYFKNLPVYHLLSHYPAAWPAAENEYRLPWVPKAAEPNLEAAALSRAAEFTMVAYDTNAPESQFLQGWLLHDHYLLRSPYGIVYEFLWANPYQPGLSYFHVPLIYHDPEFGYLFIRSSWDEDAAFIAYADGELQYFREGKVTLMNPSLTQAPLALTSAVIFFGRNAQKFKVTLQEDEEVFVLGLKPRARYDLEIDGEEIREVRADAGGIVPLALPRKVEVGVRMKERQP